MATIILVSKGLFNCKFSSRGNLASASFIGDFPGKDLVGELRDLCWCQTEAVWDANTMPDGSFDQRLTRAATMHTV
jgi:hypothetical protein